MPVTVVEKPSEAVDSDSPVHKGRKSRRSEFYTSDEGFPTGGIAYAQGVDITWQNGVQEPTGAIIEDVLALVIDRLEFFQGSQFSCRENALAITKVQEAIHWLNHRTLDRRRRGVEGSYSA